MMMIANRHRVQQNQWNKWTVDAQVLFDQLYGETFAGKNGPSCMGFVGDAPEKKRWEVIRWNTAFLAASNLSAAQKAINQLKRAA